MHSTVIFRCLLVAAVVLAAAVFIFPQTARPQKPAVTADDLSAIRSSPAYAELLLRKTELESELEALILDYTDEFPKVVALRSELGLLEKEFDRVKAVKPADAGKLTLALGKLMVKKAEMATELAALLKSYKEEHPDVKRAKRRVEIYEKAITEILGK